jgi:hypothetical protein
LVGKDSGYKYTAGRNILDGAADAAITNFEPFLDLLAALVDCKGLFDIQGYVRKASVPSAPWVSKFLLTVTELYRGISGCPDNHRGCPNRS